VQNTPANQSILPFFILVKRTNYGFNLYATFYIILSLPLSLKEVVFSELCFLSVTVTDKVSQSSKTDQVTRPFSSVYFNSLSDKKGLYPERVLKRNHEDSHSCSYFFLSLTYISVHEDNRCGTLCIYIYIYIYTVYIYIFAYLLVRSSVIFTYLSNE
jgi:hypothetical protein